MTTVTQFPILAANHPPGSWTPSANFPEKWSCKLDMAVWVNYIQGQHFIYIPNSTTLFTLELNTCETKYFDPTIMLNNTWLKAVWSAVYSEWWEISPSLFTQSGLDSYAQRVTYKSLNDTFFGAETLKVTWRHKAHFLEWAATCLVLRTATKKKKKKNRFICFKQVPECHLDVYITLE